MVLNTANICAFGWKARDFALNRDSPYEPPNQCEFLRFSGVLARQAVARTAAATWTVGNGG